MLLLFMAGIGAAQLPQPQRAQGVPAGKSEPQPAPPLPAEPPAQPPPPAQPAPSTAPPLVVQGSGQQGPVSIRVLPTPKTEEEMIAERRERDQRTALEFNLMIFAALLVGVGFFQFLAIVAQGAFIWIALTALRRPMEVAERNLEIVQRAFVYVASLDWGVAGQNVRVTPILENGGATPTRRLRISTSWRAWHGELPPDFVYNYAQPPDQVFLGARSRVHIGSVMIPMRDIQAAIEQRLQLYIWGRATYEDMFQGEVLHYVEFCFRLDPVGAAPDKVALTFKPYGAHNRSEQDIAPDRR